MYLQKVTSKKSLEKNWPSCQPLVKKAGSGSLSQWHGSEDPDAYQNVTDPQHCLVVGSIIVTSPAAYN
jgi:hypothetical protein